MAPRGMKDDALGATQRSHVRSRRRKVIADEGGKARIGSNQLLKENEDPILQPTSTSSSKTKVQSRVKATKGSSSSSSQGPPYVDLDDDEGAFTVETPKNRVVQHAIKKLNSKVEIVSLTRELEESIRRIKIDVPKATTSSINDDSNGFQNFAEQISHASLGVPTPGTMLFVKEQTSALLSWIRKLIKEITGITTTASSSAKDKNKLISSSLQKQLIHDHLFVAVHALRSIVIAATTRRSTCSLTTQQQESLIKLFFHLIVTAADESLREQNSSRFVNLGRIVYVGYNGMACALSSYSIKAYDDGNTDASAKQSIQSFDVIEYSSSRIDIHVPVPTDMTKSTESKNNNIGTMNVRQLVTIALKTSTALSKVLCRTVNDFPDKDSTQRMLKNQSISDKDIYQFIPFLQLNAVRPWLILLARRSSSLDLDTLNDFSAYCKGSHRLLWDLASTKKAKEQLSNKSKTYFIDADCLSLRKDAILLLLVETSIPAVEKTLWKTSFAVACTYAWKAAGVYHQSTLGSPDSASHLKKFYDEIDPLFEKIASVKDIVPLPFVEYKAFKAEHMTGSAIINSLPKLARKTKIGQPRMKDGNYQLLNDFVSLSTFLRERISRSSGMNLHQAISGTKSVGETILESTDMFLNRFQEEVLDQIQAFSFNELNQIFKLFCIVGLEKVLHRVVKEDQNLHSVEVELRCTARILVDCIAVFGIAFLTSHHGEDMKKQAEQVIECFIRPIAALESLLYQGLEEVPAHFSTEFMTLSNEYCRQLYDVFHHHDLDRFHDGGLNCKEKAAKFLSMTARTRSEKSLIEESLMINLYSVLLYSRLESSKSSNGETRDHHLSARILLCADSLQATKRLNSSFLAMCSALLHESMEHSSKNETDFFRYLLSKTNNAIVPDKSSPDLSAMSRSICRRLSSLLFQSQIATSQADGIVNVFKHSVSPLLTTALESISSRDVITRDTFFGLEQVLSSQSDACQLAFISSLVDVLHNVGQYIQQTSSVEFDLYQSTVDIFMEIFASIDRMLSSYQGKLSAAYRSLVRVIAASSLLPNGVFSPSTRKNLLKKTSSVLVDSATHLLYSGTSAFDGINVSSPNISTTDLLDACIQNSIQSLCLVLLNASHEQERAAMNYSELVNECSVLVGRLASKPDDENDMIMSFTKRIATWTLMRTQSFLDKKGEKTLSTVVGLLCRELQKEGSLARVWMSSSVLHTSIDGSFTPAISSEMVESVDEKTKDETVGCPDWIFHTEYELCRLRLELLHARLENELSFESITKRLQAIKLEIECAKKTNNDETVVLISWLESTLFMVHSDVSIVFGCYPAALRSTQRCLECCKEIMKLTGSSADISDDWLTAVASSTVLGKAAHRYIQVLSRRPKLYYRMGDHRKAMAYMQAVFEFLKVDLEVTERLEDQPVTMLQNLVRVMQNAPTSAKRYSRLYLEIKSWASTPELTYQELSRYSPDHLVRSSLLESCCQLNDQFQESIRDLIAVGDILYGDSINALFQQSYERYYQEAIARFAKCVSTSHSEVNIMMHGRHKINTNLSFNKQIELRNARNLIDKSKQMDVTTQTSIQDLCYSVVNSELSSSDDKAWALNYLGSIEIEKARKSGALHLLWADGVASDLNIQKARDLLHRAMFLALDSSDILARSVSRNLALVVGPHAGDEINLPSAGILVLSSIGQSLRRRMTWASLNSHTDCLGTMDDSSGLSTNIFAAFDSPERSYLSRSKSSLSKLLDELALLVPSNWKFAALVLCPSGDVLISHLDKKSQESGFTIRTECVLSESCVHAYDNILKPLDDILFRLQNQLHATTEVGEKNEEEKRKWWDERGRLDDELCELLHSVESTYFPSLFNCYDTVDNNGSSSNKQAETSASSDNSGAFPRRLSGTFENALDDAGKFDSNVDDDGGQDDGQEHDDLTSLTVPKLKDRLLQYGIPESFLRRKKKADLISLLVSLHQQQQTESHDDDDPTTSSEKNSSSDTCLFLILDENLHRFPFEGLPHLVGRTVCRVPCLSFVLATLYENQADPISKLVRCVEPRRTSFVLDPENNLLSTRDRLLPMLRDITANQGWDWDGVVGQVPSPAFFARTLTTSNGMLLYFGHGGAQSYFSRRRVEELIDGRANAFRGDSSGVYDADASDDSDVDRALDHGTAHHQSTKACKAVVVLMGCSSGRLVSVNRKNTETLEEAPLYYEPEGVALSYLCAGAPCVVGNLWDVTDHDIDRFSVSMLEHFLGRRGVEKDDHNAAMSNNSLSVGKSLAASVSISRSACKLRYLVGCAPVCYGIPVHLMSGEGGER